MKNKIYHADGTVPKSKRKIATTGKIDTPNTHTPQLTFVGLVEAFTKKWRG